MQLRASLEVTASGQFAIYRGQSEYDLDLDTHLNHEEEGIRLLQDTAFEILPELKRLHNADRAWPRTNREAFRQEAIDLLKKVLATL